MSENNPQNLEEIPTSRGDDDNDKRQNFPQNLEKIPTEELKKALVERQEGGSFIMKAFSGPLPPPDILRDYEDIQSGLANRIVSMAEEEQKHRQKVKKIVIEGIIVKRHRGQIFAFIVCIVATIGGIWLVSNDNDVGGLTIFLTSVAGLVGVFITDMRKK